MSMFADLEPIKPRGIKCITGTCDICGKDTVEFSRPGHGLPVSTYGEDRICNGHAIRI